VAEVEVGEVGGYDERPLTWRRYAQERAQRSDDPSAIGELHVQKTNASIGDFGAAPKADAIVTSPPYANRLDYTRMWAPESEIAAAIWDTNISNIQARQIGSNVVRGTMLEARDEARLPKQIVEALRAIKDDSASHASEGYYYPFFRNYAASLAQTTQQLTRRVKKHGLAIIFVRDTVRKDVLFPTGLLVEEVMNARKFRLVAKEREIVRRHVGLRRRASEPNIRPQTSLHALLRRNASHHSCWLIP
jgi:hypothetical protein